MRRAAPWLLAALLVTGGFAFLHDYGVTWDEGLGDFFFGQRYLSFFTSFDWKYLDFEANPYPPGFRPDLSMSPFRIYPWEYYPVANTMAAAVSGVLSNGLHVVDPYDGFHALNLLLGAVLLIVLYQAVERHTGATTAAIAATLFLFLSPRIVADLMANIKDFPEMVFFSLTLLMFFAAWERCHPERERGAWRGGGGAKVDEHGHRTDAQTPRSTLGVTLLIVTGALWGLALGTKANALFIPFVIAAFLLAVRERQRAFLLRTALALCLGPLIAFAAWPWAWGDPIHRLFSSVFYLATRGGVTAEAQTSSPFAMVLFSTHPLMLLFAIVGIVVAARRRTPFEKLLLCWVGVVAARLLIPGSTNFDVVRHFLEIFPPLAALAGIGFAALATRVRAVATVALAAVLAASVIAIHPFQTAYWNVLIGGTRGAYARGVPQCGDYWGVSYRKGMEWLDHNAPASSLLIVPIGEQTVRVTAPERLRKDIHLLRFGLYEIPTTDPRRLPVIHALARRQPLYVMFVLRDEWDSELTLFCKSRLRPVAEWRAGGQPIMRIYRL